MAVVVQVDQSDKSTHSRLGWDSVEVDRESRFFFFTWNESESFYTYHHHHHCDANRIFLPRPYREVHCLALLLLHKPTFQCLRILKGGWLTCVLLDVVSQVPFGYKTQSQPLENMDSSPIERYYHPQAQNIRLSITFISLCHMEIVANILRLGTRSVYFSSQIL